MFPDMMILIALLGGCKGAPEDTGEAPWDRGENPHQLDDILRLNHIQVKGTHNSYHLEPEQVFDDSHRYSHPPLTEQLDQHGVRQFELDLHLTEEEAWQVFHLPVIDQETVCLAFTDCLAEIKAWSDANGWHVPIMIWLEPKDDLDATASGLQSIGEHLLTVDEVIRSVFPEDRLFTPDDLRGDHGSLSEALVADGWPLLGEVRGQVMFSLLSTGSHRDGYLDGAADLAGRVLFVDSADTDSFAATIKDGSPASITAWTQAGFLVTSNGSRAGDDAKTAEAADTALLDAGVHHAATDMAAPGGDHWLDLAPRCNPVTAPAECEDSEVERL